jgi:DNA-binding CsgD family transcriptional regulator
MPDAVVGRDSEVAAIRRFLESVSNGAAALVLEGEAGMGKTTLWRAGVAEARDRESLVLSARPSESETALSFAGIGDLLDPVLADVLAALPAAQRRGLSRALVLEDDEGPPPDPHAVGVAVLTALRALAEERPLLLAIDDVHWLDPASSAALSYAGRRLGPERVGMLLARRVPLESPLATELRRSFSAGRYEELEVGPLDPGSLHRVVQEHLGVVLPRPLLAEVRTAAGGNPFYALEIVRMLRRSGISVEAGQPFPVPESLHELVHGRLLALPQTCRDFLLAAAAHAHPTIALTEAASRIGREEGLAPALEARVVELEGQRIRFTHPLLAAGAYDVAAPLRRAEVHARLSELLEDVEARAWQLAACQEDPDEDVASVLEDAARQARARGAPRPAALLLDRARELTPRSRRDDADRRAMEAAYFHFESGDSPRAEAALERLIAELGPGPARARALVRLARVRSYRAQDEASRLFQQAVAEAGDDRETLAIAHEGVATTLFRMRVQLREAMEHADLAAALATALGDQGLAAEALGSKLLPETLLGLESASQTAERALALQEAADGRRILAQPLWTVSAYWWWTDAHERARDANRVSLRRARELGDESSTPYVLALTGFLDCILGDYELALENALEGQELARQSGQPMPLAYNLAVESLAWAERGAAERARVSAERALELVPETAGRPAELAALWALGHLELALGEPAATVARLAPIVAFVRTEQFGEPGAMRFVVDQVEALLAVDRTEEAVELLDWYEGHARRLGRVSALAASLRCRGLLAAGEGRLEDGLEAYAKALECHDRVPMPLERARTLLALGIAQRRAKRRKDARATLTRALEVFEEIGAVLWAERARAELRRISGRAASPGALTPAEERVAALVAQGKTNREVAAALFLSERTVEGHLSRVFAKLGVRHRGEIARALGAAQTQGIARPNTGDSPVSAPPVAP